MEDTTEIKKGKRVLAIITRNSFRPDGLKFLTPESYPFQIGVHHRPQGLELKPHFHTLKEPLIINTIQEVLFVKSGKIQVDLYDDDWKIVESCILESGDAILLIDGGHGVKFLEDSDIFEIKQGPYPGSQKAKIYQDSPVSEDPQFIPVNEPQIAKNALKYVTDCLTTGWISSAGSYVRNFEKQFAQYLGVQHAITCTSGTAALHLCLLALGIGPGDEVIIPTLTMMATALAVVYTGAKPVLVDSERTTGNLDVNQIERKITARTKAIIPVHLYGHPVDLDPLMELAQKHNLAVVEDAAEVHGAEYRGKKCGTFGKINAFSFYGNKIITTGEGGMVTTDNDSLADKARRFKDLCHSPAQRFVHDEIGYNYRMTNLQAALGVAQLEEIDRFIQKKRQMAGWYKKGLSGIRGLTLPTEKPEVKNVYWMYNVVVEDDFGMKMEQLRAQLKERHIGTRTYFIPMHQQPALTKKGWYQNETYPVAEELSRRGFYLPSGLAITEGQVARVCDTIKEIQSSR